MNGAATPARTAKRVPLWLMRPGPLVPALIAIGASLGAASGTSFAGTLAVTLYAVPCPDRPRIARETEANLAGVLRDQPDLALVARVIEGRTLQLQLLGSSARLVRTLPFAPADCAALPTTFALIVGSWLDHRLLESSLAPVEPATAASHATSSIAQPAAGPPHVVESGAHAPAEPVAVGAGVGPAYIPGLSAVGVATAVSLRVPVLRSLGVLVGGSWRAPVSRAVAAGSRSLVSSWLVSASASARVALTGSLRLDAHAGPAIEVLHVGASGLASTTPITRSAVALEAGAQVEFPLSERVYWVLAGDFAVRSMTQRITVDGRSAQSIGRLRTAVLTGVSVDAF